MRSIKKFSILISLITLIRSLFISNVGAQGGRFKGIVKDEQGNPINAALVLAEYSLSVSGRIESKTDKNGEFFFRVPDTGIWKLTISAENYNSFFVEIHLSSVNKNKEKPFILKKLGSYEIPIPIISAKKIELFNRAKGLYRSCKYREALELFKQFSQDNPEIYLVKYNIGMCLQKLGEYEKAIESYQKFLGKNPEYSQTFFQIGQCYIELKQRDKALEYFEKSLQANSENPTGYYNVAEVCFYSKNIKESIEYYKKALEKNPAFADCYLKLGYAYLKINDKANALANLRKFLELNPQSEKKELIINVINQLIEELSKTETQQRNDK